MLIFALIGPALAAAWAFSLLTRDETGFSFENSVVLDDFSLYFWFLFCGIAAAIILASQEYAKRFGEYEAEFYALVLFATAAMLLLAASRDLIVIFVALETTSIAQYIMASLQRDERSTEAGMKYLLMGAVASAVILYGMAYLFGLTGTTRLIAPDGEISIATVIADRGDDMRAGLLLASVMLIAGLAFKMAVVPFQMWVPDVYQGAPAPVGAFLSVASKAAAFAVVLRIFYEGMQSEVISDSWSEIFAIVAAVSMTAGNLLAMVQTNVKRLLGLQLDRAGGLHPRRCGRNLGRRWGTQQRRQQRLVLHRCLRADQPRRVHRRDRDLGPYRQRRDRRLRPGWAVAHPGWLARWPWRWSH